MKVLMVNTPASVRFRGGDTTQMQKTAEALRDLGVHVTTSTDPEPSAFGFDLVHVFNLRTTLVTARQVRSLRRARVPIVMSPIYLDPGRALWGTRVIANIFRQPRDERSLRQLLDDLKNGRLRVKHADGKVWTADSPNRTFPHYDDVQRAVLDDVRHLLPNSLLEMHALVRTLRVHGMPFTVVPYACDAGTFLDPDPGPFVRRHGVRDFVLQAGRIESPKNQLLLMVALRDLDMPVVLAGGCLQPGYLALCRQHGPPHLTVIEHLPPDELRSAYAAARVHVLPSWIETCGLVTMEASLADCSVVVSTAGYELEYFRDLAYYCAPGDVESIRRSVLAAFRNFESDQPRRGRLKQLILGEYTWPRAAKATHQAYQAVLAK